MVSDWNRKSLEKLSAIDRKITQIKEHLIHEPPAFSFYDVLKSLFGSLVIGLTFIYKGALVRGASVLTPTHLALIIIVTLLILMVEIYFLGYRNVVHKERRRLAQFMAKRLSAFLAVAVIVTVSLVFLFALDRQVESMEHLYKVMIILLMPCAIGAGLSDLENRRL